MGFLPGLGGVFQAPATLVLFASSTSASSTITVPASIADGDIGVLIDSAGNRSAESDPTLVTPSGYTVRANSLFNTTERNRLAIFTKSLTSADSGATVTGMSERGERKVYLVFRRTPAASAISASALTKQESDGNPSAATADYSSVSGTSVTIGVASTYHEGSLSGTTFSPTETGVVSSGTDLDVYYLITTDAGPSTASVDQGDGGNANQTFLINLGLT